MFCASVYLFNRSDEYFICFYFYVFVLFFSGAVLHEPVSGLLYCDIALNNSDCVLHNSVFVFLYSVSGFINSDVGFMNSNIRFVNSVNGFVSAITVFPFFLFVVFIYQR